jgi:hypothetical protein
MTTQFAAWRDEFLLREAMAVPPSTAPKYLVPSSRDLAATLIAEMEAEGELRRTAEAMVKHPDYYLPKRSWVKDAGEFAICAAAGIIAIGLIYLSDCFGGFTQDGR